jgi:hypothetical protein
MQDSENKERSIDESKTKYKRIQKMNPSGGGGRISAPVKTGPGGPLNLLQNGRNVPVPIPSQIAPR